MIYYGHELYHYGVKGMKWGVRRTREELGHILKQVDKPKGNMVKHSKNIGHKSNPPTAQPNSIMDHVNDNGMMDVRSFYNAKGKKAIDIHLTHHDHASRKKYGKNGEHAHEYIWDADGKLLMKSTREILYKERKDNSDIL